MPPYAICHSCRIVHYPTRSNEPRIINLGLPIDHLFFALDSFNIGVAVLDRQLRFKAVNRALAEMNGLPADNHVGRPLHEVVGSLVMKVGSAFQHVFSTGQPLSNVEVSGKLPMRAAPGHWIDYYFPLLGLSSGRVLEAGVFVWEVKTGAGGPLCSSTPTTLRRGELCGEGMPQADLMNRSEFTKAQRVVLSEREREVLGFLATGKCNKQISAILGISVKTVESYRSRLMWKLHAPSLVGLVHYAIAQGIIQLHT